MHDLSTIVRLNNQAAVQQTGTRPFPPISDPSRAIEKYTAGELIRELEIRGYRVERNTV